jgi:hypothetical protein
VVDDNGVARIALPSGFERISVHEQSPAMTQLVFTVTANSLAQSVQLVQGTRSLPMPDWAGSSSRAPSRAWTSRHTALPGRARDRRLHGAGRGADVFTS